MKTLQIITGILAIIAYALVMFGGFWLFFKANVGKKPRGNGVEP